IYASLDGGATWAATASPGCATSVATSADGTKWFSVTYPCPGCRGYVYGTTNYGAAWNLIHEGSGPLQLVGCSADGRTLVAAGYAAYQSIISVLDVSTNSGATWWKASPSDLEWSSLAL